MDLPWRESQEIVHQNSLAEGPAWPVISETIKTKQIDLVIVGTHGKAASKKFVLGSMAEKCSDGGLSDPHRSAAI